MLLLKLFRNEIEKRLHKIIPVKENILLNEKLFLKKYIILI